MGDLVFLMLGWIFFWRCKRPLLNRWCADNNMSTFTRWSYPTTLSLPPPSLRDTLSLGFFGINCTNVAYSPENKSQMLKIFRYFHFFLFVVALLEWVFPRSFAFCSRPSPPFLFLQLLLSISILRCFYSSKIPFVLLTPHQPTPRDLAAMTTTMIPHRCWSEKSSALCTYFREVKPLETLKGAATAEKNEVEEKKCSLEKWFWSFYLFLYLIFHMTRRVALHSGEIHWTKIARRFWGSREWMWIHNWRKAKRRRSWRRARTDRKREDTKD